LPIKILFSKLMFNMASKLFGNGQVADLKIKLIECKASNDIINNKVTEMDRRIADLVGGMQESVKDMRGELNEIKVLVLDIAVRVAVNVSNDNARKYSAGGRSGIIERV